MAAKNAARSVHSHRFMRSTTLLLTLLAVGCASKAPPESPPPTLAEPWAPTTRPFDPTCEACVEVAIHPGSTHGGAVRFVYDPAVDDSVVQWTRCVLTFGACAASDTSLATCVEVAECPDVCKAEWARRGAVDDVEALDAFEAVFVADDAPCAPRAGERNS